MTKQVSRAALMKKEKNKAMLESKIMYLLACRSWWAPNSREGRQTFPTPKLPKIWTSLHWRPQRAQFGPSPHREAWPLL